MSVILTYLAVAMPDRSANAVGPDSGWWLVKQRTLPQYRYVLVPIPPVASRSGDPGRLQQDQSVGSAAIFIHRPQPLVYFVGLLWPSVLMGP
jgi:hypothetical protein